MPVPDVLPARSAAGGTLVNDHDGTIIVFILEDVDGFDVRTWRASRRGDDENEKNDDPGFHEGSFINDYVL